MRPRGLPITPMTPLTRTLVSTTALSFGSRLRLILLLADFVDDGRHFGIHLVRILASIELADSIDRHPSAKPKLRHLFVGILDSHIGERFDFLAHPQFSGHFDSNFTTYNL